MYFSFQKSRSESDSLGSVESLEEMDDVSRQLH